MSNDVAIRAENLEEHHRIRHQLSERYTVLRDLIARGAVAPTPALKGKSESGREKTGNGSSHLEQVQRYQTETNACRTLYLDLMKRCLLNSIYGDVELSLVCPRSLLKRKLVNLFAAKGIRLVRDRSIDLEARLSGRDRPVNAHTMIGLKRLDNLQQCIEDVIRKRIPGDLIETGVWRGGASIFMRAVLKSHGVTDRCVWVADSFQGLPPPNPEQYPADKEDRHHLDDTLKIDIEEVRSNFEKYGLLDDQVRFLKGWFSETLPKAAIRHLAVIRLDGDMYESTMDAIVPLYPKLSPGGYVIVDDYGYLAACRQAIFDYREGNQIRDTIHTIDWTGVYWQRSA
jgi:hypothetical protein